MLRIQKGVMPSTCHWRSDFINQLKQHLGCFPSFLKPSIQAPCFLPIPGLQDLEAAFSTASAVRSVSVARGDKVGDFSPNLVATHQCIKERTKYGNGTYDTWCQVTMAELPCPGLSSRCHLFAIWWRGQRTVPQMKAGLRNRKNTRKSTKKKYTEEKDNVGYHHCFVFISNKNQHQHPTSNQFFILN